MYYHRFAIPWLKHWLANQQYFEIRSRAIQKLRESQQPNPYPHKFHVTKGLPNFIGEYGADGKIKAGDRLKDKVESLAGRVHNIRVASQKLRFYDLHAEGVKIQIMASAASVFLYFLSQFLSKVIIGTQKIRKPSSKLTIISVGET